MKRFLLLLVSFALSTSQAEDIVDNLGNASNSQVILTTSGGFIQAGQAFETGPDFATLTSVTVSLRHFIPQSGPIGSSTARVLLFSGDDDVPETLLETVGGPITFSSAEDFEFASSTNSLLHPNTRYWIVVRIDDGDIDWRNTADGAITATSTGALPQVRATNSGTPQFNPFATGNFQKMKVVATPVPGITVTNTADNKDTPPDGSLRKAIADAVEGATITFDSSLTDPIVLDGMELTIDKSLIIDASSVPGGITISGDRTGDGHTLDDSRVFNLSGDITVVLKSLTITGGRAPDGDSGDPRGGGIRSLSSTTTTLWNCSVSHNRAGDSDPGGDGGGIFSAGTMTLHQSTVSHNRAGDSGSRSGGAGGGIAVGGGTMTLWNSTVSNNRAGDSTSDDGGGGGGISVFGELILWNSTITGNRAGDGAVGLNGGNGGGIGRGGSNYTVSLNNSLVAGNFVGEGGDGGAPGQGPDISSEFQTTRSGVNLIGDNTLLGGGASTVFPAPANPGEPNANGDLVGTAATPLDPLLGDLADNGGPTQTHLPLRGSPALNPPNGSTNPEAFLTDQRGDGFPRFVASIQDIGAVEAPDYASIDAAARAAERARLSRLIRKFKKKLKTAIRKRQVRKVKSFKKKIRRLKRQLRAL